MTSEEIRQYLQEDAPLTIHLNGGREFRVAHTDYALISPSGVSLAFFSPNDHIEHIRLSSIESITLEKPAA